MTDEEWEEANQKGYNEGLARGFNDGVLHAAQVAIDISGEHFKNGNDELARIMRDHYSRIKAEVRELPTVDEDRQTHGE